MSCTVDIAQGHKTRRVVAFLTFSFGLGVRTSVPTASPTHRSNVVAWEKELGNEILPDLDARSSDA